MSNQEFPTASAIHSKAAPEPVEVSVILAAVRDMDLENLFKVMKLVTAETEKKSKDAAKVVAKGKAKASAKAAKRASAVKGVMPPHLMKPRAWVEYVLAYGRKNGWEAFTAQQTRKDKDTDMKVVETIKMPGSVLHEGVHIFEGSISEKDPKGKTLIQKDAMSLSKVWWTQKTEDGLHEEIYREFEAQYVPTVASDASEAEASEEEASEEIEIDLSVPVAAPVVVVPVVPVAAPVAAPVASEQKKVTKKGKKADL
jgi:hypothetical protein